MDRIYIEPKFEYALFKQMCKMPKFPSLDYDIKLNKIVIKMIHYIILL